MWASARRRGIYCGSIRRSLWIRSSHKHTAELTSMIAAFIQILIVVLAAGSVWWLIRKLLRPRAPAEPADDPLALVPAPQKRGPRGRAAAVAVEEPEDDGL